MSKDARLSERVKLINPSITLQISELAKDMKAKNIPVIDFSVGEPDFPTPAHIKDKGKKAIDDNRTKYTQADGIPELKQAISSYLENDSGLRYQKEQIIVSPGAKASIFLALAATINPGDEVILPVPYWVSYPEQIGLVEGKAVTISTSEANRFLLDPDDLKKAITTKTKVIILNNPSNPTGSVYDPATLESIVNISLENNLTIISDEIYSKIIFDGFPFKRVATLSTDAYANTITIDGVSKAYSMTGWRIGYAAGPQSIIKGMKKIQAHLTSNPASISQYAALEAFSGDQSVVQEYTMKFQERRDVLMALLKNIPNISCTVPKGAFYVFPNISYYCGEGKPFKDSVGLCKYLLETGHIATVPGEGFGSSKFLRISFATSMENIQQGMHQMTEALARI